MKKIIIMIIGLLIISLLVFEIHKFGNTEKVNYVALGDSVAAGQTPYLELGKSYTDYLADYLKKENKLLTYNHKYPTSGYETKDVINDIKNNNDLKKALRESDLVTISIGANDILHRIDLRHLEIKDLLSLRDVTKDIVPNIDNCIKEVRKYAKEEIVIVGYYNPIPSFFDKSGNNMDILFAYIDSAYKSIADKYDCIYVSNYELFKKHREYLPNAEDIHPNLEGYKEIAKQIEKALSM